MKKEKVKAEVTRKEEISRSFHQNTLKMWCMIQSTAKMVNYDLVSSHNTGESASTYILYSSIIIISNESHNFYIMTFVDKHCNRVSSSSSDGRLAFMLLDTIRQE